MPSRSLSVLLLAEIGLVFFIVVGMRPCFGFANSVDKAEMFSVLLSGAYTEPKPFLVLTQLHQRRLESTSWEGDPAWTADPN